jgi:LETM1 and EF-hand domain-containing protein 1
VTNADLFKFIKLFEDELTLDNLSVSQLQALCRLLNISKIGPVELLRFRLHLKLRELKADDKVFGMTFLYRNLNISSSTLKAVWKSSRCKNSRQRAGHEECAQLGSARNGCGVRQSSSITN